MKTMKALMACLLLLFAGTAHPLDLPLWNGTAYNDAVPSTGADKLHALGITGKGLTTAIIDGGFDTSHEIFEGGTIHENHAAGADEHGNHVAGIVVSMAPDSALWLADYFNPEAADHMPAFAKLLEDAGGGNQYNIVSVNNSWAYDYFYYPTQQDAASNNAMDAELVRRIIDSGIAVVAASGNDALNDLLTVPAGFPGVVSVGALNEYGNIATFSNQAGVTLLAPGVDVYSAGLSGGYLPMKGTSPARSPCCNPERGMHQPARLFPPCTIPPFPSSTMETESYPRNTFPRNRLRNWGMNQGILTICS